MKGIHIIKSRFPASETADRFVVRLEQEGLNLFTRIDHARHAAKHGIKLRPTEVIIFGNPTIGTRLMLDRQTSAIDLPMKALIWEEESGQVRIGYNTMDWLKDRHDLTDEDTLKALNQKVLKACTTAAGNNNLTQ